MNATVRVRHFLHPKGLLEFPRVLTEHRRLAAAFSGFVALRHSPPLPVGGGAEVEVSVEFESRERLLEWRSSPQHAAIAAAYRELWSRDPEIISSSQD